MHLPHRHILLIAIATLVITLNGTKLQAREPEGAAVSSPAKRPATFAICASCHSVEPGRTLVGPSLANVAGRKAGSLPGFEYSEALKKSGMTWNAGNLEKWLTSPQKMVPGTKMPFTGINDPTKRQEVVNYLLTLK